MKRSTGACAEPAQPGSSFVRRWLAVVTLVLATGSFSLAQEKLLGAEQILAALARKPTLPAKSFLPKANPDAATRVCDPELNQRLLSESGQRGELLTRNFRFPDLEGNLDGTLDESKGHFCSGFRMRELLLGEFVQEGGDGTIMDWAGHPVNLDGQRVGCGVGLDIGSRNEQLANERACLVLVLQVAA